MEINKRGEEESSENELESSTLAYWSYCHVLFHPSDPVSVLNPVVTHSFVNHMLGPRPSHNGVGRPHAAEKAFAFKWERSVRLTRRKK